MVWSIGFWTTTRTRTLNCNLQIVHGMLPQRDCFSLASINEEGINLFDFVLSHVVLLAIRGTFPKTASNPVIDRLLRENAASDPVRFDSWSAIQR